MVLLHLQLAIKYWLCSRAQCILRPVDIWYFVSCFPTSFPLPILIGYHYFILISVSPLLLLYPLVYCIFDWRREVSSYTIALLSDLFHCVQSLKSIYRLLQMANDILFFIIIGFLVCFHIFVIHSSVDCHLGFIHISAIVIVFLYPWGACRNDTILRPTRKTIQEV